jgi:hypothetical protein
VLVHSDKVLTEVILNGEQLETTPEHPFFTAEKGWLPAGELTIGMHVRKADGSYGLVWWAWAIQRTQTMYNLTVGTAHTFYVGQGQWLVHNECGGGAPEFASPQNLTKHFIKHGDEFGYATEQEYLQGAQDLTTSGPQDGVLSRIASDGDTVYFKPSTDEFASVSSNNVLRTYFKPNPGIHQYRTNMYYFIGQ